MVCQRGRAGIATGRRTAEINAAHYVLTIYARSSTYRIVCATLNREKTMSTFTVTIQDLRPGHDLKIYWRQFTALTPSDAIDDAAATLLRTEGMVWISSAGRSAERC
jgi:hypothetical protein